MDNEDESRSPNIAGDLLTLVVVSIHENPLDQIVAILITRNYHALAKSVQQ